MNSEIAATPAARAEVGPAHARRSFPGAMRWKTAAELMTAVALCIAVLAVHDVHYLLRQPYWLDEAWVADSIRAPLHLTPFLTSATPIGWTLLLKLLPGAGSDQWARLVPLGFAALAGGAGYLLGRELDLQRHLTGLLVGTSVLLGPAMLARNDLKQFTAEGFASVAVMALAARVENRWDRRRLAALAALVVVGMLFAATVVFVGAAAFAGLALEAALRRRWRRVAETTAAAAVTAVLCVAEYLLWVRPEVIPALKNYWNSYYLTPSHLVSELHRAADALAPATGFKSPWLDALLVAAGLAALIWMRRPALAVILPVTVAINIVAALAKAYPFGEERTSTYWLVLAPVTMAILAAFVVDRLLRHAPASTGPAVAVATAAAVIAAWSVQVDPVIRSHQIPTQDVRDAISYVDSHYRPGDVLLVGLEASYAVAFYSHRLTVVYDHSPTQANGFIPDPTNRWVVQMQGRAAADDSAGLARSFALRGRLPARAQGRVWIVLAQLTAPEVGFWSQRLTQPDFRLVTDRGAMLIVYQPA